MKVYILGAGCSVCGNYPLASQVTTKLRDFAQTQLAHEEAKELRRCVTETCEWMMKLGVETIDQLAGRLNGSEPGVVRDAKLAMSIYFLSIEEAAVSQSLKNYSTLFEELFRYGDSELLQERVKATPCRVITYNYDRLFERTFIEWAKQMDRDNEGLSSGLDEFLRKHLNTGLGDPHKLNFDPDHFTFLKIHGGVGQFNRVKDGGFKHTYRPKFGSSIPDFTDKNYYNPDGYARDFHTIIFPADKIVENLSAEEDSLGEYMRELEEQTFAFCQRAEEIQIIGYSIQLIDYFSFKSMIREAKHCNRIVVRNRASEKVRIMRTLEGLKEEFAAKWKIEFKAEDFFGLES